MYTSLLSWSRNDGIKMGTKVQRRKLHGEVLVSYQTRKRPRKKNVRVLQSQFESVSLYFQEKSTQVQKYNINI